MSCMSNFNPRGVGRGHRDGCGCSVENQYRHSRPQMKNMLFMDTVLAEEFTVERVKEGIVRHCKEICADVSVKNRCLILSTQTSCLDYDVEYTLDLPRDIDFNSLQLFIKAEPCRFTRGPLEIEKTTVRVPFNDFPHLKLTAETLPGFYRAKYDDCGEDFKEEVFIEVDLDLRSNIATAKHLKEYGYGRHGDRDRYVLYYNNAGRLVLERDYCRTKKIGDFR